MQAWLLVTLCLITVLGLVGNTLSIPILWSEPMFNTCNCMLAVLAVLDNMALVGVVGIILSEVLSFKSLADEQKPVLNYVFLAWTLIVTFSYNCSCFCTVALAYERHYALTKPLKYLVEVQRRQKPTKRVAKLMIPTVMLALITCSVPPLLMKKVEMIRGNTTEVFYEDNPNMVPIVAMVDLLLAQISPILLLSFFNFGILR